MAHPSLLKVIFLLRLLGFAHILAYLSWDMVEEKRNRTEIKEIHLLSLT